MWESNHGARNVHLQKLHKAEISIRSCLELIKIFSAGIIGVGIVDPRILAVIPTLADDPAETIKSLMEQTVRVSKILVVVGSRELYQRLTQRYAHTAGYVECVYVKPNFQDPLGKRVAAALNHALSRVHLETYDYLLRVDADAILPKRFVEENLKAGADCVGESGYAIKNGLFHQVFWRTFR